MTNNTTIIASIALAIMIVLGICAMAGVFTKEIITEKEVIKEVPVTDPALEAELADKDKQIAELQSTAGIPEVPEAEKIGYLIDEKSLNTSVDKVLSDRELKQLSDSKVTFDEDEYDFEETLTLYGLKVVINEEDFKENSYLAVPKESIAYKVEFNTNLNTSLISSEDTLKLNLLGKEVEVSEWDGSTVTFSQGTETTLVEGLGTTYDTKNILLDLVLEDSVLISVNGVSKHIDEGATATVNGVEIYVKEVLYTSKSTKSSIATLVIGKDVYKTVSDGEEYSEDSIWNWKIDSNSIGIELDEDFVELDDEFPLIAEGKTIALPNDFVTIKYNGLVTVDKVKYTFKLDEEDEIHYVKVTGKFVYELKDYSLIYVNTTGIYDEDYTFIGTSIDLDNDELELEANTTIKISDIEFNYNLTEVLVDGDSICSNEDNYITSYGIVITEPEDSCEDQEFDISIPEEKAEVTILIF